MRPKCAVHFRKGYDSVYFFPNSWVKLSDANSYIFISSQIMRIASQKGSMKGRKEVKIDLKGATIKRGYRFLLSWKHGLDTYTITPRLSENGLCLMVTFPFHWMQRTRPLKYLGMVLFIRCFSCSDSLCPF